MPSEVDNEAYYLTWYDTSYADLGLYGEPLSSSQDESYDDTYYLTHEDYDFPSWSRYTNKETNQDYRGSESPYSGAGNWLGDYTSYFGSSLEREDGSIYGDKYGNYYSYNDVQADTNDDQWSGFGGFGLDFGGGIVDDFLDNQELPYISSWDNWEQTALYERLFGH